MATETPAPELVVERLGPSQVRAVYPLIRLADPTITLDRWVRYAGRLARSRTGRQGVLAARRVNQTYRSGVVCYQRAWHPSYGSLLNAEHYVALDLIDPTAVMVALVQALDDVARRLDCHTIRSIIRPPEENLRGSLSETGHSDDGYTLMRTVGVPAAL